MSDMGIAEAALISSLVGGGASVVGGALANKSGQQQTSTQTPTFDAASQPLRNQVLGLVSDRLSRPLDTSGYAASGVANINRGAKNATMTADNALAARGLSRSPVAAAVDTNIGTSRAGQVADFQNQLPLLSRQLQDQDISMANNVANAGRGTTSTGTGQTESGGGAAGAATNLATYLGYLRGKGMFSGSGGANGGMPAATVPSFLSGGGY